MKDERTNAESLQGASDMDSAPPVRTTLASPSLISCAALMMVWKPLPQSLGSHNESSAATHRALKRTYRLMERAGT